MGPLGGDGRLGRALIIKPGSSESHRGIFTVPNPSILRKHKFAMSSLHDTIQSLETLLGQQLNTYEGYKARLATVDSTDLAVAKDKLSAALSQVLGLLEYLKVTDDRLLAAGAQETHIGHEFENQAASVHDRFHEAEGASSLGLDHINRLSTEIAEFQTTGLARLKEQINAGKSRLDSLSNQTNEKLAHLERQILEIQNRIQTTSNATRDVQAQKESTQSTLDNKRNEVHNKERQRDAAYAESARARGRRDGARAVSLHSPMKPQDAILEKALTS